MEPNQKMELLLRAALDASDEELEESPDLSAGYDRRDKSWEVIVKYEGSLDGVRSDYPEVWIVELYQEYAILRLQRSVMERVAARPEIIYMEKPKRLYYEGPTVGMLRKGSKPSGAERFALHALR